MELGLVIGPAAVRLSAPAGTGEDLAPPETRA